ncbi:hypothetical protein SK128_019704, partial [Halocaridina rubra]
AVEKRLLTEKDSKEGSQSLDTDATNIDKLLDQCIDRLVQDLQGEEPWKAKFRRLKKFPLSQLFMAACKRGATITAWYIWRKGVSLFPPPGSEECSPLEVALANGKYETAMRLVLDMNANPFLKGKQNTVLINKFPESMRKQLLQ